MRSVRVVFFARYLARWTRPPTRLAGCSTIYQARGLAGLPTEGEAGPFYYAWKAKEMCECRGHREEIGGAKRVNVMASRSKRRENK